MTRRLRSAIYRTRCRLTNRLRDALAVLAGYCNDHPWRPDLSGGGYRHWRCALPRRHDGSHRYRNYVWTDTGQTNYLPVPDGQPMPTQPWDRSGIASRRQERARRRWDEAQRLRIVAEVSDR